MKYRTKYQSLCSTATAPKEHQTPLLPTFTKFHYSANHQELDKMQFSQKHTLVLLLVGWLSILISARALTHTNQVCVKGNCPAPHLDILAVGNNKVEQLPKRARDTGSADTSSIFPSALVFVLMSIFGHVAAQILLPRLTCRYVLRSVAVWWSTC